MYSPASFTSAAAALPPPAGQQLHTRLACCPAGGGPLLELEAFTLYHYCVAKASGLAPDRERALAWHQQLVARLRVLPTAAWPASYLGAACLLAWLSAEGLATPALLAELDLALEQPGKGYLAHPDPASRRAFFQVLRYYSLRLGAPAAQAHLHALLAAWPGTPAPASQPLGLVQGTAAELLLCLRLLRAGVAAAPLTHYVHEGLRELLGAKHAVDFMQQQYAIFPEVLHTPAGGPAFSAELSWRRGDLGQALVLYEAHALLQDPELAKLADLVGLHTLLRTTAAATQVAGASLYRGSAGVAQLYRTLHHLSQQPAYLQGYELWLAQTHSWLQAELAGPPTPDDPLRYGLVGPALVLLSASSRVELGWEQFLVGAD